MRVEGGTSEDAKPYHREETMAREKRKSGKATGALSRPKGGSDSGSKSISRNANKGEPC